MKFTIAALVALTAAIPVFAFGSPPRLAKEIANPVTVIIVTSWDQGNIVGKEISEINDMVLVDGAEYKKVAAYGPSKRAASLSPSFPVMRDIWTDHYYGVCPSHSVY
jgi:hypothetical protein